MSEWDQYRVNPKKKTESSDDEWDQYRVKPKEQSGDSWPALIGKSALKGLSTVADIPRVAADTLEGVVNLGRKTSGNPAEQYWAAMAGDVDKFNKSKITIDKDAPQSNLSEYIPSTADIRTSVKKHTGIDLEPRPDSPAQRIVAHGADFGASMAPWALPAKGVNLFSKFKDVAKATKGATAVGLGSGALQETGVNPLAADLVSSVVTPNIKPNLINGLNKTKELAIKTPMYLMGLGPNRLNIKAAQAARDLGIDLPAAVLTDNTFTGLADQTIGKTPILGNVLRDKYNKVNKKTYENIKEIYNEIGPIKTPEVEKKIFDLYEKRRQELPTDAKIKPINTVNEIDKIKINSAILSPQERQLSQELSLLKNELNPSVTSQFGDVKIPIQEFNVDRLIGTKQSLNSIIKWDLPEGVRNQLRKVQKGISQDLDEYGKLNPSWYKAYKDADNLYARTAKREKVESLLRNQGIGEPEDLSYAMLTRSIKDKKNNKLIKKHTSPETYEKINKLGIVADAIVQKNRRVPNPSGTAATSATLGFLASLYYNPVNTLNAGGILGVIGTAGTTKLITDKKFIDLALKYAEEQGKAKLATGMQLNKRVKEITGYTLNSLGKAAKRTMEEQDGL